MLTGVKTTGPHTTPNSLPCLWSVVAAVPRPTCPSHLLTLTIRLACSMQCQCSGLHMQRALGLLRRRCVIAQKCPQEGRVGRREAAARGCPRRKQCDLGFVQVSCPLEHTSNPAASVCLLPMPAPATCQPACCFLLPIATFSGSCTMCTWVGSGVRLRYNTRTHTPNNGAVRPYSTGNSTEMPTGKHYGPQGSKY